MTERLATSQLPPYLPETEAVPEVVASPERLIKLDGNVIDLEITQKCRTDCGVCYMAGRAHLAGEHIPLEIVTRRIDWICRYTDAKYLFLLGGEPLLHPELEEIIANAHHRGLGVKLITSGVTSGQNQTEKDNLALLLEKYQEGTLGINLSLHPGRNQKHFKKIIRELQVRTPARMEALEEKKRVLEALIAKSRSFDEASRQGLEVLKKHLIIVTETIDSETVVNTTVTLGPEIAQDEQKFIAVYRFIVEECHGLKLEVLGIEGKKGDVSAYLHEQFERLKKHFAPFGQSAHFMAGLVVNWPNQKKWNVRLWGAIGVTKKTERGRQVIRVNRPMGNEGNSSACSAMSSSANDSTGEISLDGALIRADGELVHSNPGCIEMKQGFANVDRDDDPANIYQQASVRLAAIDRLIHKIDALHQSERPTADKGCVSCPFDIACNLCVNNGSQRV